MWLEGLKQLLDPESFPDVMERELSWKSEWERPNGSTLSVCVLDKSYSMDESDYPPTRLEAGKKAIREFAEKKRSVKPDDQLALVTFGSTATIVMPAFRLRDAQAFGEFEVQLRNVRTGGGTSLDYAFESVRTALGRGLPSRGSGMGSVEVHVLTDGHSDGRPERLADILKSEGVVIEIVGIGGTPRDVNERLLKRCASRRNGEILYRFIGDGDSEQLVQHFGRLALR